MVSKRGPHRVRKDRCAVAHADAELDGTETLADGAAEDVYGEADGEAAEARSRADGAMPAVGLLRAEHARTEEVCL